MCREVSSLGGVSSHPEGHGVWGGGGPCTLYIFSFVESW